MGDGDSGSQTQARFMGCCSTIRDPIGREHLSLAPRKPVDSEIWGSRMVRSEKIVALVDCA